MLRNQTLLENLAQRRIEPSDVLVPEGVAGGIERSFLTPHVSHGQAQEFGALGASLLILHSVKEPSCGGPSRGRAKSDSETRNLAKQTHVQQWETCGISSGDTEMGGSFWLIGVVAAAVGTPRLRELDLRSDVKRVCTALLVLDRSAA